MGYDKKAIALGMASKLESLAVELEKRGWNKEAEMNRKKAFDIRKANS